MHIGIFDSGRGGTYVAAKLKTLLSEHDYTIVCDQANAPYGERSYDDIRRLTFAAIQPLLDCDIVILACNTATASALDDLRAHYPHTQFIGFEPMIKPAAALSEHRHITLLSTAATAHSPRTKQLIEQYARGCIVDTPRTFGWARAIDEDSADSIDLENVAASVAAGSDTIIIACTHYIALMPRLARRFPEVTILEPTEAIARRIGQLATELPR